MNDNIIIELGLKQKWWLNVKYVNHHICIDK